MDGRGADRLSNLWCMNRTYRLIPVALTAVFVFVLTVPAFAGENTVTDDATSAEVPAVPIFVGDKPAVEVAPLEVAEVEHPWTTRYIIPLFVVTAVLLVAGVAIGYNRSIHRRYKVVG